jgi:hypothetical protein
MVRRLIAIPFALLFCLTAYPGQAAPRSPGAKTESADRFLGLDLPAPLRSLLTTGKWDETPKNFRIVTLSFLADSCLAQAQDDAKLTNAARACIQACAKLALPTMPPAKSSRETRHGLWLSHYTLILGAADRLGPCLDATIHRQLATALRKASLADPHFHAPSYPDKPYRWPADQTATLASLHRYDLAHHESLADEPTQKWIAFMKEKATDRALDLPVSEVTGKAKTAQEPRGCALSWQTRYLREFAPALATTWWRTYREHFQIDALFAVGFREWPKGREHPADIDSGPILHGIGTAASALAIGAARSMGDNFLASRLETAALAATRLAGAAAERAANTQLAAAILAIGKHVPRFSDATPR